MKSDKVNLVNITANRALSFKALPTGFAQLPTATGVSSTTNTVDSFVKSPVPTSSVNAPVGSQGSVPVSNNTTVEPKDTKGFGDYVSRYSGLVAIGGAALLGVIFHNNLKSFREQINEVSTKCGNLSNDFSQLKSKMPILESTIETNRNVLSQVTNSPMKVLKGLAIALVSGGSGVAVGKYLNDNVKDNDKIDLDGKEVLVKDVIQNASDNIKKTADRSVINKTYIEMPSQTMVDVWNKLDLHLNRTGKALSGKTIKQMKQDIKNVMEGKTGMDEIKDPSVWSIGYEGWGAAVGGVADVANEIPVEMTKAGYKCTAFAPMFNWNGKYTLKDANGTPIEADKTKIGEKYIYDTEKIKGIELYKVYDGELSDKTNVQVYYSEQNMNGVKQPVMYVYDNEDLDFGSSVGSQIYTVQGDNERARMARFNRLVYEVICQAKNGKIKIPAEKGGKLSFDNATKLKAPDKLIGHEAWQNVGLLADLRLLSRAQESNGQLSSNKTKNKEIGEYLRKLANNTMTIIHNLGEDYQGQIWKNDRTNTSEQMDRYFNNLFGEYAYDIVNAGIIEDFEGKDGKINKFFGSKLQRIGFVGDVCNPAQAALCLGSKLGPVSQGYTNEIVDGEIAGQISPLVKLRAESEGIVPMPNGVGRSDKVATKENFKKLNKDVNTGEQIIKNVRAFADTEADIDKLDPNDTATQQKFMDTKKQNKNVVYGLLKDAVESLKSGHETKSPLVIGNFNVLCDPAQLDLSGVDENTPIYSMASRLDMQKGFDTAVLAFAKIYSDPQKYGVNPNNLPVLLTSGGGDPELVNYIKNIKNHLGDKGGRIIPVSSRLTGNGLMLAGMAGTTLMPSDFEPCGISDIKGMYAGSHVVGNAVGGMQPIDGISRKMYDYNNPQDKDKANSILVPTDKYKLMCLLDRNQPGYRHQLENYRSANAEELAKAIGQDCKLAEEHPEEIAKMDINAFRTNISWDQGALQNYLDVMKIKK